MNKTYPLLLFLGTSFQCFADTPYVGVDYMLTNIELASEDVKPRAAVLRAGVSNNNMAFEAQYILPNNSESAYRIEFDIQKSVGVYFVMQSDENRGVSLDVSLGYAMTEMNVSGPKETYNGVDNYNGFSWGVAINQQIPYFKQTKIRLAYQSLYKDSDIEITGISLGLTYKF